jgi:hypothetical protein
MTGRRALSPLLLALLALAVRKKVPNPRENPVSFAIIYAGGNVESLTLHQITRDG